MKKLYFSILAACAIVSASAATVTTIANGNATNPFTWSCTCIPMDGDSIIINHALVLDSDFMITSGAIMVNASGSITGNTGTRILAISGGRFVNAGTVTIANIYHSAGPFTNNGTMTINSIFGADMTAQPVNNSVMNVNDTLLININATLTNNGSIVCPEIGNAGMLANYGSISCDNLYNSGFLNNNSGNVNVVMNMLNSGTFNNSAPMTIGNDFLSSENVVNSNYMSCDNFYNGDTVAQTAVFTNNGTVSVAGDFVNSRTVDGTGRFCVALVSTNSGAMNGTFDFCDLSGGSVDLNVGTIAGTITYCSSSCTIGMNEESQSSIRVFPNPVTNILTVNIAGGNGSTVRITNITGQVIFQQTTNGSVIDIPVHEFANGVYQVVVTSENYVATTRFVKQ